MPEDARSAFGGDRLESAENGEVWLRSPLPKSWTPRREKTLTTAEYPGTAVAWHGEIFEVLRSEPQPDGAVRYRLAPWPEGHAIRRMEHYDAENEAARGAEHDDRRSRVRSRRLSILLAPLAGLLPGEVQQRMEGEFGAPALAMTISSALPLAVVGFLGLLDHLLKGLGASLDFPSLLTPPYALALYLLAESAVRLASAFAASEPMGSLPVVLVYGIWRAARSPQPEKSREPRAPGLDPERAAIDRFRMLEPMLSLLAPAEQQIVVERFGFEAIRWGKITAAILILVCGSNAVVSLLDLSIHTFGLADAVWLGLGGLLAVEQVRRWRVLRRGAPAGSILGVLVRPLAKPLLRRES